MQREMFGVAPSNASVHLGRIRANSTVSHWSDDMAGNSRLLVFRVHVSPVVLSLGEKVGDACSQTSLTQPPLGSPAPFHNRAPTHAQRHAHAGTIRPFYR